MARLLALVAVLASLSVTIACASTTNSPEEPDGSVETTIALTPTSAVAAASGTTGIAGVDIIVAAAATGDIASLRQRLRFTPTACVPEAAGLGGPPLCRADESVGALIDVLPVSQCEGAFPRSDELQLGAIASGGTLYGVYRAPVGSFPAGKWVAVFSRPRSQPPTAFALVLNDDSIVGIHFGCGQSAEGLARFKRLTEAIVR